MTKPSRMLLVVGLFAVAAVVVLGMMASRYGNMLEQRDSGIEGFIDVREELKLAIDDGVPAEQLKQVRDEALASVGLEKGRYFELLRQYRSWKRGREKTELFEQQRERLEALDLGAYERPDL